MNKTELSKMKLLKGDSLLRAHSTGNTLSGVFESYNRNTDVFIFLPAGTKSSKSEFLSDITSIVKLEIL